MTFVLNTHWHGDHTGGNVVFGRGSTIVAHENVRKRLVTGRPPFELGGKTRPAVPPAAKVALPVVTFQDKVSVHFNGWNGKQYGNPNAFSESRTIHARFETALVRAVATEDLVAPRLPALHVSSDPILTQVGAYLTATASHVPDVYRLEAAGGIDSVSPAARRSRTSGTRSS